MERRNKRLVIHIHKKVERVISAFFIYMDGFNLNFKIPAKQIGDPFTMWMIPNIL